MIRVDRELLADLARMNSDVAPLAIRIMGDRATVDEQRAFADRLIDLGTRLHDRAHRSGLVIDIDTDDESRQALNPLAPPRLHPATITEKGIAVLTLLLTICAAYLAVMGGVVLVSLPSWRRTRRATAPGRHHWRDQPRPAITAAPHAGGAR